MTEPAPAHAVGAKPSWEWEQCSFRMNLRQSRNPIWGLQNKRLSIKKSQIRPLHLERSSNSVLACHFFFGIEGSASWEGLSAAPDAPAKLIFISANLWRVEKSILFFQFSRKSETSKILEIFFLELFKLEFSKLSKKKSLGKWIIFIFLYSFKNR